MEIRQGSNPTPVEVVGRKLRKLMSWINVKDFN